MHECFIERFGSLLLEATIQYYYKLNLFHKKKLRIFSISTKLFPQFDPHNCLPQKGEFIA